MNENYQQNISFEETTGDETVETQIDKIRLKTTFEIPLSSIQFSSHLGSGNFGNVFKARINGIDADIAAKTIKGLIKLLLIFHIKFTL